MAIIALAALVAGCQPAPRAPAASPSVTPTPSEAPLVACSAAIAPAGPEVLARNLPAPDDLALAMDGRLLFSDITAGTVSALNPDGSVERLAAGLSAPEGMVVQTHDGSGRILVAEQGRNRVMAIDPRSRAISLWRGFPNRTANGGLDGIGPELPDGDIVVPDSPNHVVWRVSADGKSATEIASGMDRPVGAAVDAIGRIFVADEGGALWVLDPARHRFETLATPDDVLVGRAGDIFVNTIGDNAIHEFDAQGGQVSVIAHVSQPQGIALDGADNLFFTEFNLGRIGRVVRTFLLDPAMVTAAGAGHFIVCPNVRRAAGFTDPLTITVSSTLPITVLRQTEPGSDTSGALEVQTPASAITITVSDTQTSGPLELSQTVPLQAS
jgi:sugar lactone lactonase YvrE